jgi:hypothetical protein
MPKVPCRQFSGAEAVDAIRNAILNELENPFLTAKYARAGGMRHKRARGPGPRRTGRAGFHASGSLSGRLPPWASTGRSTPSDGDARRNSGWPMAGRPVGSAVAEARFRSVTDKWEKRLKSHHEGLSVTASINVWCGIPAKAYRGPMSAATNVKSVWEWERHGRFARAKFS